MKDYKAIKEGDRYTIGEWDEGYKAYTVIDDICGYYFWDSAEAAQKAADAYNAYTGAEWLCQHGYGNDFLSADEIADYDSEMVDLYKLFHAVKEN